MADTGHTMSVDEQAALAAANMGALKKKMNADSWSDHMEDLMKAWGEKAAGLRWIHSKDAGTWKGFADRLSLWGIGLTTIASTAAVATANMEVPSPAITYTIGGVGMIATLVQSVKKFYSAGRSRGGGQAVRFLLSLHYPPDGHGPRGSQAVGYPVGVGTG